MKLKEESGSGGKKEQTAETPYKNYISGPKYDGLISDTGKHVLLIDLDGVVFDWYRGFLEQWTRNYPNRKVILPKDVGQFFFVNLYPEEYHDDIFKILYSKGFYEKLKLMHGALKGLNYIYGTALDVVEPFLCTAPELNFEGQQCFSEKATAVQNTLGDWWLSRLIITKDKTLVRGHYLIDDKPVITGCMKPTWTHVVFDHPYNQSSLAPARIDWDTLPQFIEAVRLTAQQDIARG